MRLSVWLIAVVASLCVVQSSAQAATQGEIVQAVDAASFGSSIMAYLVVVLVSILLALSLLKKSNR